MNRSKIDVIAHVDDTFSVTSHFQYSVYSAAQNDFILNHLYLCNGPKVLVLYSIKEKIAPELNIRVQSSILSLTLDDRKCHRKLNYQDVIDVIGRP